MLALPSKDWIAWMSRVSLGGRMQTGRRVMGALGICAVVVLAILVPTRRVMAHGQRAELAFYGDFGPQAARCQRVIARAAAQCVAAVVTVRATCLAEQMQGQPCDGAAADAAADAARQRARAEIQTACSAQDAGILQFLSVSDAQ